MSRSATTVRQPLPQKLATQVRSQFTFLEGKDLTSYTYERAKSNFTGARTDLTVFNPDGKLVLNGRDFGDHTFFWQP
jgi:hypothetical protein